MYIYVSDVSPKALIHAMNFIQKRENESKRSGVMICYHDKKNRGGELYFPRGV